VLKIGPEDTRRERNKRSKLQRIEASARRLFREHGYDATPTRAIAEEAGIAAGTLFVYFPEKLDLLVHLYKEDLERVANGVLDEVAPGTPLVDAAHALFDALYRFYEADTALARTFVKELMFLDLERQAEMMNMTVRVIERIGALVAAAQERGEVDKDVPVPLAAHQIFGLYYWGLVRWLAGAFPGREAVSVVLRMELGLLMHGLSAKEGL
jgi:AcrR family transcriptional regulator